MGNFCWQTQWVMQELEESWNVVNSPFPSWPFPSWQWFVQELEESRASWNVVKAKTAESEEQWVKLKADFAERKRFVALFYSTQIYLNFISNISQTQGWLCREKKVCCTFSLHRQSQVNGKLWNPIHWIPETSIEFQWNPLDSNYKQF